MAILLHDGLLGPTRHRSAMSAFYDTTWRWGVCCNLRQFPTPYHFSSWTASPSPPQRR